MADSRDDNSKENNQPNREPIRILSAAEAEPEIRAYLRDKGSNAQRLAREKRRIAMDVPAPGDFDLMRMDEVDNSSPYCSDEFIRNGIKKLRAYEAASASSSHRDRNSEVDSLSAQRDNFQALNRNFFKKPTDEAAIFKEIDDFAARIEPFLDKITKSLSVGVRPLAEFLGVAESFLERDQLNRFCCEELLQGSVAYFTHFTKNKSVKSRFKFQIKSDGRFFTKVNTTKTGPLNQAL
ncbi:unnamed protein product [Caenorhabditis auriculariae]|uniref:Uncharacterized protein n=1 Tax=Caenorhabditis auriculariae TaxID=2777116 RepID=A0A8S1H5G2_9PELO|nr:unnamed protein product [Caenorhabditis auriculariae]